MTLRCSRLLFRQWIRKHEGKIDVALMVLGAVMAIGGLALMVYLVAIMMRKG